MRPKILDLYCCAGGAARGYHDAGFDVYGVDIDDQQRYPYAFARGDVIALLTDLIFGGSITFLGNDGVEETLSLGDFAAVHASPPCQMHSRTKTLHSRAHPQLIEPTRELLKQAGLPWVIENVVGAPLIDPVKIDGRHFGMTAPDVDGVMLKLVRARLFESNVALSAPESWFPNKDLLTASIYGAGGGGRRSIETAPTVEAGTSLTSTSSSGCSASTG